MYRRVITLLAYKTQSLRPTIVSTTPPNRCQYLRICGFIQNLLYQSQCSYNIVFTAIVYFRQLQIWFGSSLFTVLPFPCTAIFTCALILARKATNDSFILSGLWVESTYLRDQHMRPIPQMGFSTQYLNTIERHLLSAMDWKIHVSLDELQTEVCEFVYAVCVSRYDVTICLTSSMEEVCFTSEELNSFPNAGEPLQAQNRVAIQEL